MSNREYSRIFIKRGKSIYKIANIRATRDESIILTLYEYKNEKIDFIIDGPPVRKIEVQMGECAKGPKISFHKSGIVKMMSEIVMDKSRSDRVTLTTTPFNKIRKPQRMIEIFLPRKIKKASGGEYCSDKDIVLDANGFPMKQLRITVFVTKTSYFKHLGAVKWVSTSLMEYYNSIERSGLTWTFVLRNSTSDIGRAKTIGLFIYGKVRCPTNCSVSPSPSGRGAADWKVDD